jgi:hypothetical protein
MGHGLQRTLPGNCIASRQGLVGCSDGRVFATYDWQPHGDPRGPSRDVGLPPECGVGGASVLSLPRLRPWRRLSGPHPPALHGRGRAHPAGSLLGDLARLPHAPVGARARPAGGEPLRRRRSAYTVWSEVHNTQMVRTWAYAAAMPQIAGIGLGPHLQWSAIPPALVWLLRRRPGGDGDRATAGAGLSRSGRSSSSDCLADRSAGGLFDRYGRGADRWRRPDRAPVPAPDDSGD